MTVTAAFHERAGGLGIELPGGEVLFSTGHDVMTPAGEAAIAAAAGIPPERWARDHQVHGTAVRRTAREADLAPLSGEYDGQATTLAGVAAMVRTADCLPIALISPQAVGMLHAGWRGLAAGVVQEGVAALRDLGAQDIRAAIGPAAGVCCYEAGEEVHAALAPLGPGLRDGRNADLKAAAVRILQGAGVGDVQDCGICTICAPAGLVHSHRRDADGARNAALAWRS